jgi:hypothetical protein
LANTCLPKDYPAQPRAAAIHNDFIHLHALLFQRHQLTITPFALKRIVFEEKKARLAADLKWEDQMENN